MNHIKGLRTILREIDADALLLTCEISQRYATGFPFSDGYVLITDAAAYLLTDFRYREAAEQAVDTGITVKTPISFLEFIGDIISAEGIERLGYEDRTLTCHAYRELSEKLPALFIPIGERIEALRSVKDSEEIARIQKAQSITDRAFSHILSVITPKMTEIEVALELEYFMRREGAESVAFPTIAVSGAASALPHGVPRNKSLEGGFLTMDFGASYDGYASDMTRTVSLGKATEEMKRIYKTVLTAQALGIERIRAGVPASAVDGAARAHIDGAGYHGLFGHSFGHGVGLEIHEAPRLSSRNETPLKEGSIVTAEPGIYLAGECGCRIENMGLVTKNGFLCFTQSDTALIELF